MDADDAPSDTRSNERKRNLLAGLKILTLRMILLPSTGQWRSWDPVTRCFFGLCPAPRLGSSPV